MQADWCRVQAHSHMRLSQPDSLCPINHVPRSSGRLVLHLQMHGGTLAGALLPPGRASPMAGSRHFLQAQVRQAVVSWLPGHQPVSLRTGCAWSRRDSLRKAAAAGSYAAPAVKVCGVVSEQDAALAAQAGASFVGAILAAGFSRTVEAPQAKAIFAAARQHGAEPVGVFVEETAEQIVRAAEATGLRTVQLHGTEARLALPKLPPELQVRHMHSAVLGLLPGCCPSCHAGCR